LKKEYAGGIEAHRLLSTPFNLLANAPTRLPRSQVTVKGFKMSTIPTPCFKGFAVFRDFIAPTPAGDHPHVWVYIGVVGGFEAV